MVFNKLKVIDNNDIDFHYKDNKFYGGWFNKNELPTIKKKFYIINLQNSNEGPGTHWTLVYNVLPKYCLYFDPFGILPPPLVEKFMKKSKKICIYNDCVLQANKSNACGFFCFYVIDMLQKKRLFTNIIMEFLTFDTIANEKLLNMEYEGKNKKFLNPKIKGHGLRSFFRNLGEKFKRVVTASKGPRKGAPPQIRKWLQQAGNLKIVSIHICRVPISSYITGLLNLLTFGKFETLLNQLIHDKLFHLYSYLKMENGQIYRIEKDYVVKVTLQNGPIQGECHNIQMPNGPIILNDYINNANNAVGDVAFWVYRALSTNCQHFQTSLLRSNKLLTNDLNSWINQDVRTLFSKLPRVFEKIANAGTDLAAKVDIITSGESIQHLKGGSITIIK
jgi:hypothetical protein